MWYVALVSALALLAACWWLTRGVLPAQRTMLKMDANDLRQLVIAVTPIGTDRREVENALRYKFRRAWKRSGPESVEYMQGSFSTPVTKGDYYYWSDFANVGLFLSDVVTVRFLFDETGELKEVKVKKWSDAL